MNNAPSPRRQHLAAYEVLPAMQHETDFFLSRSASQVIVLALAGGVFVTLGALFSLLLSTGVTAYGPKLLLQGLGFSAGFFMIILSRAALFTEANVILPASYLHAEPKGLPGGVIAWLRIVVSGMLGNGLIGMAAFFATMANTLIGKYIPIFLVVSLFVAGNLQHSPANMGYFSLSMASGGGPGWSDAFCWNVIPAGIGNLLGGTLLVALPFWYALKDTPVALQDSAGDRPT